MLRYPFKRCFCCRCYEYVYIVRFARLPNGFNDRLFIAVELSSLVSPRREIDNLNPNLFSAFAISFLEKPSDFPKGGYPSAIADFSKAHLAPRLWGIAMKGEGASIVTIASIRCDRRYSNIVLTISIGTPCPEQQTPFEPISDG